LFSGFQGVGLQIFVGLFAAEVWRPPLPWWWL